ncbi:Nuclear phosphoprotein UL3 [Cacatuid alphaherpesvirus 2]|uniref:Nuclear phosphoprotein UL3 n=1 Tax=Cacatuid alphaherpesvirus 2 TaxID=2604840 RepID=A0A5B9R2R3_9ALPH|nr:Nuclear phosphoprotein UL3 [Cacatuid alphaherpesvirus 2]QEG54104.1 Nuclear phosphoprotein UL3 [Cacatuid alphaherpesvirus 2]
MDTDIPSVTEVLRLASMSETDVVNSKLDEIIPVSTKKSACENQVQGSYMCQGQEDHEPVDSCGFDSVFMIFSFGELGRRQLTDNIRKDVCASLDRVPMACTKTSAFAGAHKTQKSLQMFLFCKRRHAPQVRARLRDIIASRKSRKYFTQSEDGETHPGVPVFFHEFVAHSPVFIPRDNLAHACHKLTKHFSTGMMFS